MKMNVWEKGSNYSIITFGFSKFFTNNNEGHIRVYGPTNKTKKELESESFSLLILYISR